MVILELFLRKVTQKALWISANKDLAADAKKELSALKMNKFNPSINFEAYGGGKGTVRFNKVLAADSRTILFTAYSVLRSGKEFSNLIKVADWMGTDFDGIVSERIKLLFKLPSFDQSLYG